jgi:hypothetical protein
MSSMMRFIFCSVSCSGSPVVRWNGCVLFER